MLTFYELKKIYRPLLIYRLRTFLSILGILFGVLSLITMLSIGEGAKQEALEQIKQLGMNTLIIRQILNDKKSLEPQSPSIKGLSQEDVAALSKNLPFLTHIAPLKVINTSITPSHSPEILAVTRQYGEMKNLQLLEGRFLCDLDLQAHQQVCVLGYDVAKTLGAAGHIHQHLKIAKKFYKIIGVLKPTQWQASKNQVLSTRNLDKIIFIPLDSIFSLPTGRSTGDPFLSEIILKFEETMSIQTTLKIISTILKKLHGSYENYQLVVPQELFEQALRTQKTFNWILGSIAALSLLIGGIGIMNIMLATVSERTHEIGIRRALGASQKHILMQFLAETLLLTLTGAFLGIFLGIGLAVLITFVAEWKTIVTFQSIILSVIMACLVGIGAGLYPAFRAAKMDPIAALRYF